jgi:hypothetical protein
MEKNTILNLSTPKGEFVEPPQYLKPITASSYEFHPGFYSHGSGTNLLGVILWKPLSSPMGV